MRKFLAGFLLITFGFAGMAQADQLACTLNVKGKEWIAPDAVIVLDKNGTPTHILDGIIANFVGENPIPVTIVSDEARAVTFEWRVNVVNGAGQRSKFLFHASLFKADLTFHELSRPIGYSDTFTAVGKCARVKG